MGNHDGPARQGKTINPRATVNHQQGKQTTPSSGKNGVHGPKQLESDSRVKPQPVMFIGVNLHYW